jgi:tRNA dimethylallyltransferase
VTDPLLCIMGPTAAGKTDAAIALAQQCNAELISVDSALVYRGLEIGAAQPDYPHHLIDIRDPLEIFTAADFVDGALEAAEDVRARGKVPIFVGGTMMYFKALLDGLSEMPASDPEVRAAIEKEAIEQGWPEMHRRLQAVDAITAESLHPNHSQRISRALEVYRQTGVPMSQWRERSQGQKRAAICVALAPAERRILHERIEHRFDDMLADGFLEEVAALYQRGDLHVDLPAVRAVGYRQLWSHLSQEYSLEIARERGIAATRQLAKRQITWLRSWSGLHWLDSGGKNVQEQVKARFRNYL